MSCGKIVIRLHFTYTCRNMVQNAANNVDFVYIFTVRAQFANIARFNYCTIGRQQRQNATLQTRYLTLLTVIITSQQLLYRTYTSGVACVRAICYDAVHFVDFSQLNFASSLDAGRPSPTCSSQINYDSIIVFKMFSA